ncbi:uncharacterized protein F4812DRAFT_438251 [Daldinia caldariorum]|uniref:uncharacterized protein n=1 Tax=Daldinia caldariorum TaxID=326644 RepID=UPI0020074852|nr:uncharacterized protein F4812DRAFT_438251 [Daldinia caldariorum]KAI1465310.1 hypothetical protein F4812DRAFT_438251 [Daldinia caldariorum]
MRRTTTTKRDVLFIASVLPCAVVYYCVKYSLRAVGKTFSAVDRARQNHRIRTRKRPKSKPLAVVPSKSKRTTPITGTGTGTKTSFLHLPPEIRLMIYHLALGDAAIIQVRPRYSVRGPRPETWSPMQGIRGEHDPPSETLRRTIGLGGSPARQIVVPPRCGCVGYGARLQLICGETFYSLTSRSQYHDQVFFTDLLRVSRAVYNDGLDLLYANHTISLFGVEMARYFCRNASPEGMARVRCAHVALLIPASTWNSSLHKRNVRESIKLLRSSLPHLQQLDVEVAVTWGQPKDAKRFWSWLVGDDMLGQFRGLDEFVLKASAYIPFARRPRGGTEAWTPEYEILGSWDEGEYQALKERVTNSDEVVGPS